MYDYNEISELVSLADLPKSRDKLWKILQSIEVTLGDLNVVEIISSQSKSDTCNNCTWDSLCQFLVNLVNWFFNIVDKDRVSSEWFRLPLNKKIIELAPNLLKIVLSNASRENRGLKDNGLFILIGEVLRNYSSSIFNVCLGFLKIITSEMALCSPCHFVNIPQNTWQMIERSIHQSLSQIVEFEEQHVLLLMALVTVHKLMIDDKLPELDDAISCLVRLSHLSGLNSSIKACGFVATIYTHLVDVHGLSSLTDLTELGVMLSRNGLIKTWTQYQTHRLTMNEPSSNVLTISPSSAILNMWRYVYILLDKLDNTVPEYIVWVRSVTVALCSEMEFMEKRQRCSLDPRIFEFTITLLTQEKFVIANLGDVRFTKHRLIHETLASLLSEDCISHLFWLNMIKAGLNKKEFVSLCRADCHRFVAALNAILNRPNVGKEVIETCLDVAGRMAECFEENSHDFSLLTNTIIDRYLSSPYCEQACVYLKNTVIKEHGSLSPSDVLPSLLSCPITNHALDLVSTVIGHIPSSVSVRELLSTEICCNLLRAITNVSTNSKISFANCCTTVSTLIGRKSSKACCYRRERPVEDLTLYDDKKLSLEDLIRVLNLRLGSKKKHSYSKPDIVMLNFGSLSKPERHLLDLFLNTASRSTSLVILLTNLSMLSEIVKHEEVTAYSDTYLRTVRKIQHHLESTDVVPADLEGIGHICWNVLSNMPNQTDELREATAAIISTTENIILRKLSDILRRTDDPDTVDLFKRSLLCYLSFLCRGGALARSQNMLAQMCDIISLTKRENIHHLHYILRAILQFKVRMPEEFYSTLLVKLRQGFKVGRENAEVCGALIDVITDIVIVVVRQLVDSVAGRKIVDFFYDLGVIVRRVVETNFPRNNQLGLALARQMGVMYCYYWVENGGQRCADICAGMFPIVLKRVSLVGHYFVRSIVDNLPIDQISVVVPELISGFPKASFRSLLSEKMGMDERRCRTEYFLQMWLLCPIFLVESTLLPFVNTALPDSELKCELLSKFVAFFHGKGANVTVILSTFLFKFVKMHVDYGTTLRLPDGVDIQEIVEVNAAELLWAILTNEDGDCENVVTMILTFTRFTDLDDMIVANVPQLVARSIVGGVTIQSLSQNKFMSVAKERIVEVYIYMMQHASLRDDVGARFRELCSLLNEGYLHSQSTFDGWLRDRPCRLIDLVVTFVDMCDDRDWKSQSSSWNTLVEVLLTSHTYWHTPGTHIDTGVSFLILRHLNSMKYSILHEDASKGMDLLCQLVLLADKVVTNVDGDLPVMWHQQIFHFFSLFWHEAQRYKDVLVNILRPLVNKKRWYHSLEILDQFVLSTVGFCDLPPIAQIINEPDLLKSLTDFLALFERYDVTLFRYHAKFFEKLCPIITSLGPAVKVDVALCSLLHRFSQIARNFLTLCMDGRLYLEQGETNSTVMTIIPRLKIISSLISHRQQYSVPRNLSSISVLGQFYRHLFYGFGYKALLSYWFLCSADIKKDDLVLADCYNFVYKKGYTIVKQSKVKTIEDEHHWDRMFSNIVCQNLQNMLATDVFNASTLVDTILPYLGGTSPCVTSVEYKEALQCANAAIKDPSCNQDKRCKIMLQFVLSQLHLNMGNYVMENFDLMNAAKMAYKVGMYTASLLFLERVWIHNEDKGISEEAVNLYRECYKQLGCVEEFSGESFLVSDETVPDSHMWLLNNGKFDVLKQLMTLEPRKADAHHHAKRMDILWRLSRWDDEEKYEVHHINPGDAGNLLMYDTVYSKSEHIVNEYKMYTSVLCSTRWDEEECLEPLMKLATISQTEECYEGSLSYLLNISNKSNISQLESSLTWNLVSLGRCNSGEEVIAKNSRDICDMALRCSRLDYIDLILDMFTNNVKSAGHLKCAGETACFRMVAVQQYWNRGDKTRCSLKLEELLSDCKSHLSSCSVTEHGLLRQLYCEAVSKLCLWNRAHPMHSAKHILHQYLDPAIKLISDGNVIDPRLLDALSTFSCQQYLKIKEYMRSSEYENRCKILSESRRDIGFLGDIDSNSKLRRILQRQSSFEEGDLSSLLKDRQTFLISAVNSCIQCLQWSDKHDHKIFGLISMFLDNDDNVTINSLMNDITKKIPSYKFLVLLPQLCARLNSDVNTLFQKTLEMLIEKIALDHPYHSLYNIFAIRNAAVDTETVNHKMSKRQRLDTTMDGRRNSATKIINVLLKSSVRKIVRDIDLLTEAYIKLAQMEVVDALSKMRNKGNIPLPSKCNLLTIGVSVDLPNPLMHLTIDKSCKYSPDKLVKIIGFGSTYSLAGGVNMPKIIRCAGSDGVQRQQLVKGKDDPRQDSVMQQVFSVVNDLMRSTQSSELCDLAIRTYKVIPTSNVTGIIEWCEGTEPLGDWLTDAHLRLRPQDLSPIKAKSTLFSVKDQPLHRRMEVFMDIYRKMRPVFGYFLIENFPDPRQWFKARKAYTHSLAINSMVGFVLGLGDRHVQNILVDTKTAELIHIDLGIAFDQGRLLPTPEVVPFRLTRDMVHALGPFGVDGRFKSTCCTVLNMLRAQKDIILTLIEVLVHDPLHAWSLSPQQAHSLQAKRMADGEGTENAPSVSLDRTVKTTADVNQMAERVILELSRKLSGTVDHCSLQVEGHVNYLIQTALDIDNLVRMYCGWQAYL